MAEGPTAAVIIKDLDHLACCQRKWLQLFEWPIDRRRVEVVQNDHPVVSKGAGTLRCHFWSVALSAHTCRAVRMTDVWWRPACCRLVLLFPAPGSALHLACSLRGNAVLSRFLPAAANIAACSAPYRRHAGSLLSRFFHLQRHAELGLLLHSSVNSAPTPATLVRLRISVGRRGAPRRSQSKVFRGPIQLHHLLVLYHFCCVAKGEVTHHVGTVHYVPQGPTTPVIVEDLDHLASCQRQWTLLREWPRYRRWIEIPESNNTVLSQRTGTV
mmetsp:Transcript_70662/g.195299  ORF Transcript_70662/g.195299 Transcript_70662/m.195299 type:complete len:270 (-) Transcript_70662:130-939(-)